MHFAMRLMTLVLFDHWMLALDGVGDTFMRRCLVLGEQGQAAAEVISA